MSRYHSYLNTAATILKQYNGEEVFSSYIKKIFAANKKYGSRDRKLIAHYCYCCFRLGKAGQQLTTEEQIITGLFLTAGTEKAILEQLRPEWEEAVSEPVEERARMVGIEPTAIFPWKEEVSSGVEPGEFSFSFFQQPDVFLRLRPGHEQEVKKKLKEVAIPFIEKNECCIALPNTSRADQVITLNKEAVVQDYNSQQTATLLLQAAIRNGKQFSVWDCCAASGGKSMMLYDLYPQIDLTVSDVRESILVNLRKRFREAGIQLYTSFQADLSKSLPASMGQYDLVLADVPCSGSGTWGRTPEQLYYFDEKKIAIYSALQQQIVRNIWSAVKPGGYLLYITCSVFKQENEEVMSVVAGCKGATVITMKMLTGYTMKADSLFAALVQKNNNAD